MVVAAHHHRDAGRDVVRADGHVVDRRAIGAKDDEILDVPARKRDALVYEVVPLRRSFGRAEAQHERSAGGNTALDLVRRQAIATAVVLESLTARVDVAAALVELGRRAEAAIHGAGVEHPLPVRLVACEVRTLIRDLLVPAEAEPLQPLEDRACAFIGAARAVRVLDAEEKRPAVPLREEPVVESRASTTDMQIAGW